MHYNKGVLKFEEIIEGGSNQLEEYFRYIVLNQQMNLTPWGWENE